MEHILIAEDDSNARSALASLFEDVGYEVTVVANGEEALRTMDRALPDLVISDIAMPGLGGFDLVRHLRALPGTRHIPFVFLSAYDNADRRISGLQLGADDFLPKPSILTNSMNGCADCLRGEDMNSHSSVGA